jgi:hypothetical protein
VVQLVVAVPLAVVLLDLHLAVDLDQVEVDFVVHVALARSHVHEDPLVLHGFHPLCVLASSLF